MADQTDTLTDPDPGQRVLFISHKHTDSVIADVLREFVEQWTSGQITVFQSSSAQAAGPRIGRPLRQELKKALRDASVVLFLHTRADDDWSTCMWEVGVATDPDNPDTKVVLLECGHEIPAVFAPDVRVNLREFKDVKSFVNELLTAGHFFPTFPKPVTAHPPNSAPVDRATQELLSRLQDVLPPATEEPAEASWPFPFMTLQLTFDQVKTIGDAPPADRLRQTVQLLEEVVLVLQADTEAGRVFGVHGAPQSVVLKRLISAWRDKTPTPNSKWIEGLACQMMDAALGQFPTLRWELMRGADRRDGTWYGPAVVGVRRVPVRRVTEFDVSLCKFSVDAAGVVEAGVPAVEPDGD